MVTIPWPLSTSPGSTPQEGAGRLINAFPVDRGEQIGPVYHRVPGVTALGQETNLDNWTWWSPGVEWFNPSEGAFVPLAVGGSSPSFRGGVLVENLIYGAWGEKAYTLDSSGTYEEIGPLSGTDRVYWARNNNSTPDIVAVCAAGAFVVTSSSVTSYPDPDVGSPNSVTFDNGYFIFSYGSGRALASDVNSTNINSLNFINAELNPDGLLRPWSYQGQLYLGGPATIEVFGDPLNLTGFPRTRVGYNITPGLIAADAIAGFETEFAQPIYCASDNTVRQLNGYSPDKISPPELDELIARVADKSTIEALCYQVNGHHFWQLSSPTWTWVFNLNSKTWHERHSYLSLRSRFTRSIFAFDKWYTGDTDSGYLLELDGTVLEEVGDPLIFQADSSPVKGFPDRQRVARADFDFVVGVGIATGTDPMQTNPTVLIYYSDDGGYSWKGPYERKLGRQAKTLKRIILPSTGMTGTQGRRWRVMVSDPVHVGLMGGTMDGVQLRK